MATLRPDGSPGLLVRPRPELDFVSLGFQVAHWWEHFFCHGPGDLMGDPIEIDDELLAFVAMCYAVHPDTGARVVTTAMLSRLKGRSKSEIGALFCLAEAAGPVRFSHWAKPGEVSSWGYQYTAGEPVGRPVRSPLVRILATEEGQTGNTYDNVIVMLEHAGQYYPDVFHGVAAGQIKTVFPGGGIIEPVSSKGASKDGGKETFALTDEPHLYVAPGLHKLYATVSRNLKKRKAAEPWMLLTSTWFEAGELSVAELLHSAAVAIHEGKARNRGLLYDHLNGVVPKDWDDDRELLRSLKQAAGAAAPWMNLAGYLNEIRDSTTTRADAERYFLNTSSGTTEDLLELAVWRALAQPGLPLADGDVVTLGFDGSNSHDRTALYAYRWPDMRLFEIAVWVRPAGVKTWAIPRLDVDEVIEQTMKRYRVIRGRFDPPLWRTELDTWRAKYGEKQVESWPTYSETKMCTATDRFLAIVNSAGLSHEGTSALDEAVGNTRRKKCRSGIRPDKKLDTSGHERHNDELIAAILAVDAMGAAIADGDVYVTPPPATANTAPTGTDNELFRPTGRLTL